MQKTQLFYDPIRLPEDFPLTIPSFSTPPEYAHIHDCFEIGCCYSGTGGVFQIGAKVYACNPGDVVFINEQEYHILNEATPRNSCWKFINLNPAALLAGYIAPEENFFDTAAFAGIGFQNVISADRAPELVQLVHILFAELEKPDWQPSLYIRAIVWAIFSKLRMISTPDHKKPFYSTDDFPRLYPALNHIASFWHKPLDIPHLAAMCNMSVTTFRKRFFHHKRGGCRHKRACKRLRALCGCKICKLFAYFIKLERTNGVFKFSFFFIFHHSSSISTACVSGSSRLFAGSRLSGS